jgi:type I restriction enzyme M protein
LFEPIDDDDKFMFDNDSKHAINNTGFSVSNMKNDLSLFIEKEIRVVEDLIIERNGKFHIKCQIIDRYKLAKPE